MNLTDKRHFENLDALRFIAFLFVFGSHAIFNLRFHDGLPFLDKPESLAHLGRLGVDFFFVLSSFLITWIILEEQKTTGEFHFGFFLVRRILRIWPLYFLIVLIGYSLIWLQHYIGLNGISHENPSPWWFISFTINFYVVFHGDQFLFLLVFLWSIAIEEQFYLVWGVVMKWLKSWLVPACLLLILTSIVFRYLYLDNQRTLYFHTLSAIGNFGAGALLAVFSFRKSKWFYRFCQLSPYTIAMVYATLFTCIIFYPLLFSPQWIVPFERFIFSALFAFVIFEQSFCDRSVFKIGKLKPLNYLGKISYGLYCYHGVIITLLVKGLGYFKISGSNFVEIGGMAVIIFILNILAAAISYRFFEKRFLGLKRLFY